ncbi:elongator complex protein 6 [Anthonomus grandis grandis]|uniref:elongator complex protein 6 n=1 Tax=Anthonomus grandis grandis TaxID=2921223 RepID=UPI002166AAE1|nr:elongator complex protein 6 [Anthonomus grandis grandis]XP_050299153.1 elongator complex protein 6 [Anthonomus grandis grandis]XP_050299154.1 elongator complex protein 6 [Anthonomus grandis grandis]
MDPRVSNPVLSSLNIKPEDKIIFIQENSFADSNFIITHLIKQLLYDKSRACVLTLHNTVEHYQNVGKKLGYDLNQAIQKGEIRIIDPMEELVANIGLNEEDPRSRLLTCLYAALKTHIEQFLLQKEQPVYLIIDDLSHFLDLGLGIPAIINFTNLFINLTSDKNIFAVINSHVSSKSDLIVADSLHYICDLYISVSPLKTGKSSDVSGLMTIQRGEDENRYHFRTFDRGVKTFHPGESIYNLYK